MPQNRTADLELGSDAYLGLVPSAAYALGTYHVGLTPTVGAQFPTGQANAFSLIAGAPNAHDILFSAGKYLALVIDITAITATGTVQATIFGYDPISGKFFPSVTGLLQSALLGAVATTRIEVGPALPVAANVSANDFVPFQWSLQIVVATAGPMTFSIGAHMMP